MDIDLFEKVKAGNVKAFQKLFDKYWYDMYKIAYAIVLDKPVAEDIIQDVWISIWERRAHIRNINIEFYLKRAVRLKALKHLRDTRFTPIHEEMIRHLESDSISDKRIKMDEFAQQVERSLGELPDRCREVFELSRFQDMSNLEIATKLGISKRTVEGYISQASSKLKGLMGKSSLLLPFLLLC